MKKMNKKGFTLTELVIVIVIIAILAAVLIPSMTGYVNRAKKSNAQSEASSVYTVYAAWLADDEADNSYYKAKAQLAESSTDDDAAKAYTLAFAKYYAVAQNTTAPSSNVVGKLTFVAVNDKGFFMLSSNNFEALCVISSGAPAYTISEAVHASSYDDAKYELQAKVITELGITDTYDKFA